MSDDQRSEQFGEEPTAAVHVRETGIECLDLLGLVAKTPFLEKIREIRRNAEGPKHPGSSGMRNTLTPVNRGPFQ